MENFVYIIFMIIIIIVSNIIKSRLKKAAKQKGSSNFEIQPQTDNEIEDAAEKNESSILEQLFKDFTVNKESKESYETISLKQEVNLPPAKEIKKVQGIKLDKEIIKEDEKIEIDPEIKKPAAYSEKTFEDNVANVELPFDRIKKLNYMEQAIVLSEILGKPKGFDI